MYHVWQAEKPVFPARHHDRLSGLRNGRAADGGVGDKVNAGDTVVILEAMKMQNNIEAETSGTITGINVNKGDAVMEGDTLVTIV